MEKGLHGGFAERYGIVTTLLCRVDVRHASPRQGRMVFAFLRIAKVLLFRNAKLVQNCTSNCTGASEPRALTTPIGVESREARHKQNR